MITELQRGRAGKKVTGSTATWRRQRGNSLVEHALVLAVLLAVMFGIFDFGRVLYTYNFVSNAAREATRWASVRGYGCNNTVPAVCTPATPTDIENYVKNIPTTMGLDPGNIKFVPPPTWVAPPNNSPACAAHSNNPGCIVRVTVEYDYSFFMPLMPSSQVKLTSTSEMVITQ